MVGHFGREEGGVGARGKLRCVRGALREGVRGKGEWRGTCGDARLGGLCGVGGLRRSGYLNVAIFCWC